MTGTIAPAAAEKAARRPEPVVNADKRTVIIGGLELTPEQAKTLAYDITVAATNAESAVVHKAGDIFSTGGLGPRYFISDGVFLFGLAQHARDVTAHDPEDLPNLRLVRLESGESLGDVIRTAVTG